MPSLSQQDFGEQSADHFDWLMHAVYLSSNAFVFVLCIIMLASNPLILAGILASWVAFGWNMIDAIGALWLGINDLTHGRWRASSLNIFSATQLGVFTTFFGLIQLGLISSTGTLAIVGGFGAGFGFALAMLLPAIVEYCNARDIQKEIDELSGSTFSLQRARLHVQHSEKIALSHAWLACAVFMASFSAVTLLSPALLAVMTVVIIAAALTGPVGIGVAALTVAAFCTLSGAQRLREKSRQAKKTVHKQLEKIEQATAQDGLNKDLQQTPSNAQKHSGTAMLLALFTGKKKTTQNNNEQATRQPEVHKKRTPFTG